MNIKSIDSDSEAYTERLLSLLLPEDKQYKVRQLQTLFYKPQVLVRLDKPGLYNPNGNGMNSGEESKRSSMGENGGGMNVEEHQQGSMDPPPLSPPREHAYMEIVPIAGMNSASKGIREREREEKEADELKFADEQGGCSDNDDDGDQGGSGITLDDEDLNPFGGPMSSSMGLCLLNQPIQVGRVDINYAQTAKRVDVKLLKQCMWQGIEEGLQNNNDNKDNNKEQRTSFQTAINTLYVV